MAVRRVRSATFLVMFLAVFLAGFQIRQDITISFEADSSGRISASLMLDEEAFSFAGGESAGIDAVTELSAEGWSAKLVQDSDFRGFTATIAFRDQTEFGALANDLLAGQFSEFSYSVVDDVATFRTAISSVPTRNEFGELLDDPFTLVVNMPGDIRTSSAGTVEGSQVTWVLSTVQALSSTERLTVTSDVEKSSFGGTWFLILTVGTLSILAIVAIATWGTNFQPRSDPNHKSVANGYDPVTEFLRTTEEVTTALPATAHSEQTQSTGPPQAFCASCGTQLQAGDRFCPSCGKPTEPPTDRI